MIRESACHSTIWKGYARNITTKNIKREKEKDFVLTKTVILSRYEHISSAAQTVPPVCAIWKRLLEPREGLPKNAALRAHIGGLGGTSINGGKKDHYFEQ